MQYPQASTGVECSREKLEIVDRGQRLPTALDAHREFPTAFSV